MKLNKVVENIGTSIEVKRIASAYVIDYRGLDDSAIRAAISKTAPQYYYLSNVKEAIHTLFFSASRDHRTLSRIFLKEVLLNQDNYISSKKHTEDEIIAYEQSIIDRSNEDLIQKSSQRTHSIELFQFLVETAWEHNSSISLDEKNLIEKVRNRLKITETEYRIIEAKIGKFPKAGNDVHTRSEIEETRRLLQSKGIIFSIRNDDGTDFDIIPEEIAKTLRSLFGIELKRHGYQEMISYKYVRSKAYYFDILKKCEIEVDKNSTTEELQRIVLDQVKPSVLLGGISPRDGLEMSVFRKWCSDLKLPVSGTKVEYISRLIEFYDNLLERSEDIKDHRELWYEHFDKFASRDLNFLRGQQLIEKDIECEAKFEAATNYLFEKRLHHNPLKLIGSAHADGVISYQDKVILWDNKSKEKPVHLKDHVKQFQSYINSSERPVAAFWVIGPDFTPESIAQAMQLTVQCGTTVTLIKATDLKDISERWEKKCAGRTDDPFPLGYLVQPGILNTALVAAL